MTRIPDSELILNADGSIYHLHLKPEEIADTIITVGDQDRVHEVSKHFDSIEFKLNKREFVTHTGYLNKKRISVISTGIGTDNIDIVFNELDALVNIDFETKTIHPTHKTLSFYRIGTSGSLQEDIPIDSLLVSLAGIGLDNLMHFYADHPEHSIDHSLRQILATEGYTHVFPYFAEASSELLQQFDLQDFEKGITATCPGFYAPQGRKVNFNLKGTPIPTILNNFKWEGKRVTNFEMETAAMYGLSNILGHRAISLNAILANRITNQFSSNPAKIIEKLILKTLDIITNQ